MTDPEVRLTLILAPGTGKTLSNLHPVTPQNADAISLNLSAPPPGRSRILLVNMPFAARNRPSFALSQLASLIRREHGEHFDVEVCYLNQQFAEMIGVELYDTISDSLEHLYTGVGDWLFRRVAFPQAPDNTQEYLRRFYRGSGWQDFVGTILDVSARIEDLCETLVERNGLDQADILGFTSMFTQTVPGVALARLVKQRSPGTITLMGGANCEAPMGQVLARNLPSIDYVFSGPALHSFADFLGLVEKGQGDRVSGIAGIVDRRTLTLAGGGAGPLGRDREINDTVVPDYTDFVRGFDRHRASSPDADIEPELFFETSRGCWWGQRSHCTFCGLNGAGMEYRSMSPAAAVSQLNQLFQHSPWCSSYLCTDNILPRDYFDEVLPKLRTPEGASLYYEIKLPVSERHMQALSDARVNRVQPGVEALSTSTLQLMRKGTTAFHNLQFLKNCIRHGISPDWNLLIGFPGEPEQTYQRYAEILPLLHHLPPPSGAHMIRFDRYSPYHQAPQEYGLELRPMDFYEYVYPFPAADLADLAYFFADDSMAPYMVSAAKWSRLLNQQVVEWQARWEAAARGEAPRPQLELHCVDGASYVLDSRGPATVRLPVSSAEAALLERLASPAAAQSIQNVNADWTESALAALGEQGLLFEESGRVLSLVVTQPHTQTVGETK